MADRQEVKLNRRVASTGRIVAWTLSQVLVFAVAFGAASSEQDARSRQEQDRENHKKAAGFEHRFPEAMRQAKYASEHITYILVGLKEGVDIKDVVRVLGSIPENAKRIHNTGALVERFKKALKKDATGQYKFRNRIYASPVGLGSGLHITRFQ